jgi:hypothetical protein
MLLGVKNRRLHEAGVRAHYGTPGYRGPWFVSSGR